MTGKDDTEINMNEDFESMDIRITDEKQETEEDEELDLDDGLDFKGNKKSKFWLVSIFSATGQFFFGSFFSAFAAEANVSGSLMGFITSIRNLLSSIFQGIIGYISDLIGRKLMILIGIVINFAITIPLLFFESTWLIIVIAIVQALSLSIFVPAWNAVLGDVTKPEIRASFIGKIAAIGRLISVTFSVIIAVVFYLADEVFYGKELFGWVIDIPWRFQYNVAFGIAALNSLICAIIIFTMKETKDENIERKKPNFRLAFKERNFMKFVVFYSLFGFSMSFIWPVNPIMQVNVLNMQFYQIAIMTSIFTIIMSLVQVLAGKLGDKFGRKPIFIIGGFILVFYPLSNLPSLITGNWLWQILSSVVAGFGTGTFFITLNALTLDLASEDLMGSFSGIREMFWGIATFIGSLISGFIVDAITANYNLLTATIAMCIGVTVLRLLAATGFFFVAESLPKQVREERKLLNGKYLKK